MSRKDDFKKIIAASSAAKQHAELSPTARQEWERVRDKQIRPILDDASTALREMNILCKAQPKNGEAFELLVGPPKAESYRHITFTRHDKGILLTSSEPGLEEDYDSGMLTEDDVVFKVGEFLKRIASQ